MTETSIVNSLDRAWRHADFLHTPKFALKRRVRKLGRLLHLLPDLTDEELVSRAPTIVEYEGNRFDLTHPRCTAQIGAAIIERTYEGREIDLIRRYVEKEDKVLELGACMGVTSLILHDIVGRDRHLVVEADRRNLELSRHMFALNSKDVRIEYGLLVSGDCVPKTVQFSSNQNPSSSSAFERTGTDETMAVPALGFEELLDRERFTVIILDIEGGEYDLFVNARSLGSLHTIVMEAHPWVIGEDKMDELLRSLQLHSFEIARSFVDGRFLMLQRNVPTQVDLE